MIFPRSACIETLYTELPFLERIGAAGADGFELAEFWGWEDKDLDGVKAAAERAGVGIAAISGDKTLSLIDPAQRADYLAYLRRSVAAAQKLGARCVVLHSNGLDKGVVYSYEDLSDTVKICAMYGTLLECAKLAENSGVMMVLEPLNTAVDHPGVYLTTTRMAAELTRAVGSPMVKVLYDAYHMYLTEGDLAGNIRAWAGQFGHVHIADAPGRHEPGTGTIDYRAVLDCLAQAGYRGAVGFEFWPLRSTAEAVRSALAL